MEGWKPILHHIRWIIFRLSLAAQAVPCSWISSADAYVMYQGWKRIEDYNIVGGEDNEQYATPYGMPAWYTLNLKAGYAISEKLTLQAGIDNITDQHYRVFASGVSAPGRNLYPDCQSFYLILREYRQMLPI